MTRTVVLRLVRIMDGKQPFAWMFDNQPGVAYTSLTSPECFKWVGHFPPGTVIYHGTVSVRFPNQPDIPEAFIRYCKSKGIVPPVVP